MRVAAMNDIIDFWWRHRGAVDIVLAFCAVVGLCAIARLWRVLYVFVSTAAVVVAVFAALQLTSVRIHPFDHSWDVQHEIPLDANITRMAKRARFDAYVCGIPPIGRGKLRLDSAARHGSDYDLFFIPTWASETLVVYRFAADGKALWKTCNWVKT
jgi:hypothetical protein